MSTRRTGDTVPIPGDYQFNALTKGPASQRFWHLTKQLAISSLLPPASGDFVLDVGCGSGVVTNYLGTLGARALGVDGNPDAIQFARENFSSDTVTFHQGLVDEQFSVPEPVDKIYCLELIEHIYWEQNLAMLALFRKYLKPAGKLFITTPNYRSAWPIIESAMDRCRLAPQMDAEQHVTHFTTGRLRKLFRESGFQVITVRSFCFLAPWVAPLSWRLAQALHRAEVGTRMPFGSLLLAIAQKTHA